MHYLKFMYAGQTRILAPVGEGGSGSGLGVSPEDLLDDPNDPNWKPKEEPKEKPIDLKPQDQFTPEQLTVIEQYKDQNVTGIDANGNLIDKDGKIVVEKDNIKTETPNDTYEIGTEVTIDNIVYTINENGDLVDAEGKVFKPASEVKEYLDSIVDTELDSPIEAVMNAIGVTITDEQGNPIQYEDSIAGLQQYFADSINQKLNEYAKNTEVSIFAEVPQLKDVYNYIKLNGSLEGYGNVIDYSSITYDKDNEEQNKQWITQKLKGQGHNDSEIRELIDFYKDKGVLGNKGKESFEFLQTEQVKQQELTAAQLKEKQAQELEYANQYWTEVKETILTKEVAGYTIPAVIKRTVNGKVTESTKEDFYKYMSESVDDQGNSQADLDRSKLSKDTLISNRILENYLLFTGGDYSSLVRMKVAEDKTKSFKEQFNKATKKSGVVITRPEDKKGKGDPNDII